MIPQASPPTASDRNGHESPAPAAASLLTIEQVAAYLQVCRTTVLRYARAGLLPAIRVGNLIRFRREELERVLRVKR